MPMMTFLPGIKLLLLQDPQPADASVRETLPAARKKVNRGGAFPAQHASPWPQAAYP